MFGKQFDILQLIIYLLTLAFIIAVSARCTNKVIIVIGVDAFTGYVR